MSAIDSCEPQIIRALEKQGWQVDQKPFVIRTEIRYVLADFSIQKRVNGRFEQIVVVEVKCFTNPQTDLAEFYAAIGQYLFYRSAMRADGKEAPLFLAVPSQAYLRLQREQAVSLTLQNHNVKLIVVDLDREEVEQWIT